MPFLILVLLSGIQSCEIVDTNPRCTGCPTSTPYSSPNANTCYATLSDRKVLHSDCTYCRN